MDGLELVGRIVGITDGTDVDGRFVGKNVGSADEGLVVDGL